MGSVGRWYWNWSDMDLIKETLLELFGNKDVQDELIETGRIYFTSNDVTINLVWSILILGLLGLVLKPLFGIPLLENILGAMTGGGSHGASYGGGVSDGYGAPSGGYGAPSGGYGAPSGGYGAPSGGYGAPSSGYDSPSSGYDSPSSGYDSPGTGSGFNPGSDYSAPDSGYSAGRRKRAVEAQDYLTKEELEMFDDMGLIFAYPSQSLNNGPLLSHLLPQLEAADSLNHLLE